MKILLALITLFSLCGAWAQSPRTTSSGCEPPRGDIRPAPTQEAADGPAADNAYIRTLGAWTQEGNRFAAPFTVPFSWANRQVLLRIDGASAGYEVRIGGRTAAFVADGNAPAEINVTRMVREGRNELEIVVDTPAPTAALESWKSDPAPAVGRAQVLSQPTLRIRDVLVKTWRSADDSDFMAEVAVAMKSDALNPRTSRVEYELLTPSGLRIVAAHQDLTLDMRREDTVRFLARIPADSLWSPEHPHRYTLRLRTRHAGRYDEYQTHRLGFRTAELRDARLHINERPVALRACEASPQSTPEALVRLRAEGCNTLQLQPGSVAPHLYDTCDSLGLLVIAQAPVDTSRSGDSRRKGGNPSNDPAWRGAYLERAETSYHTAKRHPSVVAFSLARRAANGICLYETYLAMKRHGDRRPFLYPEAAGEWNADTLPLQ